MFRREYKTDDTGTIMLSQHFQQSMDPPDMVVNHARGQLNREK